MNTTTALTPILQKVGPFHGNELYLLREDLLPFSFGGNKARKAHLFFEEVDQGGHDALVTYGSSSSNHCRIVANLAAARKLPCYLISPSEQSDPSFNTVLTESFFGAKRIYCPVEKVAETIDETLKMLQEEGKNPYFIQGGGHGFLGTKAYFDCYAQLRSTAKQMKLSFDTVFHATGTGTTQAGLVAGKLFYQDKTRIVGISIARNNPRCQDVVKESVADFFREFPDKMGSPIQPPAKTTRLFNFAAESPLVLAASIDAAVECIDDYIGEGYGAHTPAIAEVIRRVMTDYGVPLDHTYTGKAFYGMEKQLEKEGISDQTILFVHTGGTPLFFDHLQTL